MSPVLDSAPSAPTTRRVPTTEAQREIWTAAQLGDAASLGFNEAVALTLDGPLDRDALQRALEALIVRHEALRAHCADDGRAFVLEPAVPPMVQWLDWSDRDTRAQDEALAAHERELVDTPFDLAAGPLARVTIVRRAADRHVLTIAAHHIVCDGWSFGVLARELGALYSAERRGVPSGLPPADTLATYAASERDEAESEEAEAAELFWTTRFREEPAPLELPLDHARPRQRRFEAGRIDHQLEPALVRGLRELAQANGSTLFSTLLTGFATLLHRIAGADDVVIGIPTAGQVRLGTPHLVSHCVNLLPVRVLPQPAQPFTDFQRVVQGALLDAMEHQQLTFGALLKLLPIARDPARLPLVSVVFNVDRGLGDTELGFDGLHATFRAVPRTFENFELFLNVVEYGERLSLELQYSAALFEAETVQRWLAHYESLLLDAVTTPSCSIGRLTLLTDDDRDRIARFERGPQVPVDEGRLIHQRVADMAAVRPEAIAVSSMTEERRYAELDRRANRLARALRARGVRRDVPVGVLLPRDVRLPETIIGVLRAGGAYVPLDPDLPLARLHFLVDDAGLRHVVTSPDVRRLLPEGHALDVLDLEADADAIATFEETPLAPSDDDPTPDSTSFVIYTSGSTGIPKGCRNTHRGLLNFACSNSGESGPVAGTVVMALAASGFDASVGEITMGLSLGAHLVIVPRDIATDGLRLAQAMEQKQARLFFGSPASFQLLLEAGWRGHPDLTIVSGGEALSRELASALTERAGRVWNVYGPTECAVWVTRSLVSPPPPRIAIGAPMANTHVAVLDAFGARVPVGVAGELFIGGPNVGSGYIRRDTLTAERFVDDPDGDGPDARRYRTGDLVRWLPTGELEFLGRNDDQVKLRGFRIELGEIASRLEELPEVAVAVALVRAGEDGDRRLVAWVQRAPGSTPDEALMRRHLAAHLPAYMVPQAFVVMDAFPLLATGKINRRALPAPSDHSTDAGRPYRAPGTPLEETLAAAWARALRVARVSVDDDFFELGGHSLLASQILATLRSQHALEVPYRLFFEAPTVASLARAIEALAEEAPVPAAAPILPRRHVGHAAASITQRRLFMLEALDPSNRLVLAHGAAWRLHGQLDVARLEDAMRDVMARHEPLRTRFALIDGDLRQIVEPEVPFALHHLDVSTLPVEERQVHLEAYIERFREAPFDHDTPPLFRALLARVDRNEHVLFTLQHGLIWDGWSFDVFLDDLTTAYAARRRGTAPDWTALPITYADYAAWQAEHLRSDAMERQVAWWRGHLGRDLPVLELPTDRPRPSHPSFEGGRVQLRLDHDEVEGLRRTAQREGATLFQFLFAAFHALLHRYTGQERLVVAMPLRNRSRSEVAGLIGPFTNTVAVRCDIRGSQPFADVLRAVRADCVQALEHEEMPFERLEREAPAVRALFSMQDARGRPHELDGCRLEQFTLTEHTATNDLMLWTMEYPSSLLVVLAYRSDLFDATTAETLLAQYRALVRSAAADPTCVISRLDMRAETAMPASAIHDTPVALTLHDGARAVTWGRRGPVASAELRALSKRLAHALRALELPTDGLVLARVRGDASRLALQLAALEVGCPLTFLHADDSDGWLHTVVATANPSLVITDRSVETTVPHRTLSALAEASPETAAESDDGAMTVPLREARVALVTATARGPELVRHEAPALAEAIAAWRDALGLRAGETVLDLISHDDDAPPLVALAAIASDAARWGSDEARELDGDELCDLFEAHRPDVLLLDDEVLRTLHDIAWEGAATLRVYVVGIVDADRVRWLAARVAQVTQLIGIPEALGIVATGTPLDSHDVALLPTVAAHVLDAEGAPAAIGVRGRLALGPDPTTARRTSHVARRRADGTLVIARPSAHTPWIAGRARALDDISAMLADAATARDAAFVLLPDAAERMRLVAVLAGAPDLDDAEVRRRLRALAPTWAIPAGVVRTQDVPRNEAGAPQVASLANPWERRERAPRRIVPESPAELELATAWRELLGVETVRLSDNFFALGGHSLLCFRLIERVRQTTGVRLDPRALLFGTLERVAADLGAAQRDTATDNAVA